MSIVSLLDYTPIPRFDNTPWHHALIQEAATEDTPNAGWVTLENIVLSPPDADPTNPQPRSFTVDGTLDEGWYRVVFVDQTGNQMSPTEPVHNVMDDTLPYTPLVSEVGALILSRTRDKYGVEVGTFNKDTRPTFHGAQELIDQATRDVTSVLDSDIPEGAWKYVREAIATRAAMLIERSYFGDQINSNRSSYNQLRDDYKDLQDRVSKAVEREAQEEITGEAGLTNRPSYSFPAADPRYRIGRPL